METRPRNVWDIAKCERALRDANAIARSSPMAAEVAYGVFIARPDDEPSMVDLLSALLPHWYTGPFLIIDGQEPRGLLLDRETFLQLAAILSAKLAAAAASDPPFGTVWALVLPPCAGERLLLTALPRNVLFIDEGEAA